MQDEIEEPRFIVQTANDARNYGTCKLCDQPFTIGQGVDLVPVKSHGNISEAVLVHFYCRLVYNKLMGD